MLKYQFPFSRSSTPLSLSLPPTYSYSYLKSTNVYAIRMFSSLFEERGLACSGGGWYRNCGRVVWNSRCGFGPCRLERDSQMSLSKRRCPTVRNSFCSNKWDTSCGQGEERSRDQHEGHVRCSRVTFDAITSKYMYHLGEYEAPQLFVEFESWEVLLQGSFGCSTDGYICSSSPDDPGRPIVQV